MGDSSFLWEGGITFLNSMTGTDRLCDEGPGQDDEGRGGNAAPRTKYGWYDPAGCLTTRLLKIWVWMPMSFPFSCQNRDTCHVLGSVMVRC
jgi:hypothetical protein